MKRNIFIFDQNKCVGCHACVVACVNENGYQSPEQWRNVFDNNPLHYPGLPLFYLSLACNHCLKAPCIDSCPSNAYSKNTKTGAVDHNPDKCIGCKYCTWTCPFDAPKFNPVTGIIEKCTFCNERLLKGEKPACASLCPTGALETDFAQTGTEKFHRNSVADITGASIKIIDPEKTDGPKMDMDLFEGVPDQPVEYSEKKLSSKKEWPIFLFSLLSTLMVTLFIVKDEITFMEIAVWWIPLIGIAAAIISVFHLGKKMRAWKALFNIKKSWLSREILFFTIFLIAYTADYYLFNIPDIIITITGLLLLFSIDMLYMPVTRKWKIKVHSGQVLFVFAGIWLFAKEFELAFILFTIIRAGIFAFHKGYLGLSAGFNAMIGILRILMPVAMIIVFFYPNNILPVLLFLILTDILDRISFYEDLKITYPGLNMDNPRSKHS